MKITNKPNLQFDAAIKNIGSKVGKVGYFKGAIYDNGIPVAYVATIQEYGVPEKGIPSRSFMRSTIEEQKKDWSNIAAQGSKAVLNGKIEASDLMEMIGQKAAGDIRKKISTITTPALSPNTIKARMNKRADKSTVGNLTKPLVDTGLMLQSLTHVVENK